MLRNWARLYHNPTPPEVHAEKLVALLGKRYRAQHPFFGKHRIVDFALLDDKIIIEVDGASHDLPVQRRKDITSTLVFEEEGWRVVRFRNEEILRLEPTDWPLALSERITHRPTPEELRRALQDLDRAYPGLGASSRKRKKAPGPKRVKKRAA